MKAADSAPAWSTDGVCEEAGTDGDAIALGIEASPTASITAISAEPVTVPTITPLAGAVIRNDATRDGQ